MITVKKDGEKFPINCNGEMCGVCSYNNEPKCTLFATMIDRVNCGINSESGVKRCEECLNAEVKE